ncbi:hypothetical protein JCM3765_006171 [Sporobolomyces pararoseus]
MSTMDYEELEEAYKYIPEPTPIHRLDRTTVLEAHSDSRRREQILDATGQIRTRRVIVGGGKHYSSKKLEELKPFSLSDKHIRIDEVAKGSFSLPCRPFLLTTLANAQASQGRLLVCRVAALPARTASVQLVVEDSEGLVVPVSLFRVPSAFTSRDLEDIYSIGSVFAIKEPFIRSNRDGYYIRVESPSDLARLFPNSPLLDSLSSDFTSKHNLSRRSGEDCKSIGNKAFQAQRWHVAKEAYTWSLAIIPSSDPDSLTTTLRATLLSNLALTNLKLSLPSSARLNCLSALQLFPSSVFSFATTPLERKLLYRLSLALYSLENYNECISTLEPLGNPSTSSPSTPDSDSINLLSRARSRLLEQTQATYDFPSLYRQARNGKGVQLDVADYFARDAVEVKQIKGKGKGLVAKRRIERGELLMVCKPVASAGWSGSNDAADRSKTSGSERKTTQYLAGVNLWTKSEDPWPVNEVTSQLAWKTAQGAEDLDQLISDLWPGDEVARAGGGNFAGDVSRLEGIVTFNGFRIEDLASSSVDITTGSQIDQQERDESFSPPTALYPSLPSALNHSCLPNTSYTFISNLFILRARRDIGEGEELVISYLDQKASLEEREVKTKKHGFVCDCELCEEERKVGKVARRKREALRDQAERVTGGDDSRIRQFSKIKKELEETYTTQTTVRPVLYSVTRLLSRVYASQRRYQESIEVEKEGLEAVGAVFEETKDEDEIRLLSPPLLRDTDAVLSALWIGKMWKAIGEKTKSSAWSKVAREIERGQAGQELFDSRYLSTE